MLCALDEMDGERLALIQQDQLKRYYGDLPESMLLGKTPLITTYPFEMSRLEGFRYRCSDALRSVTGAAVKKARTADLKAELLNSARLKTFLEDRPKDAEALVQRHDRVACPKRIRAHLRHVPNYLLGSADSTNHAHPSLHSLPQAPLQPSNRSLKRVNNAIPQSVVCKKGRGGKKMMMRRHVGS